MRLRGVANLLVRSALDLSLPGSGVQTKKGDSFVFLYVVVVVYYGSIGFCVIASTVRLIKFTSAPLHLRWELYRSSSIYELSDWWNRPQVTFLEKMKSAVLDIIFLRDFYHRNRGFWYFLFLFHLGIYLLILWHVWYLIVPLIVKIRVEPFWDLLWGHVATAFAFLGGLGIFVRRMTDEDLRVYYPPAHYVKWAFMLLTVLGGFYAAHFDFGAFIPTLEDAKFQVYPPNSISIHLLFSSVWLIYLPYSHILRLFFRYYHQIRWDDVPNVRGSAVERKVEKLLNQRVGWSAPHVPHGRKWADFPSEREQEPEG